MNSKTPLVEGLDRLRIPYVLHPLDIPLTRRALPIPQSQVAMDNLLVGNLLEKQGRLRLVVTLANQLIDPQRLSQQLGGSVEAIDVAGLAADIKASEWGYLPLPSRYQEFEVWVDNAVLDAPKVFIPSKSGKQVVELNRSAVKKLYQNAQFGHFAFALSEVSEKITEDPIDEASFFVDLPRYTPRALRLRLEERHELPVLSTTAQRILQLQSDPNAEIEDLVEVASQSPSLAAQVVKWANSPYYGFSGQIKTLEDAIVRVLGFDLVMNMALGITIGDRFKISVSGPLGLRAFWQHAISAAALIERLVKKMPAGKRPMLGMAYLCGLLHNFGTLLIGEVFPDHFGKISELVPFNMHLNVVEVERLVLGVGHDQLGSWLMQSWSMPEELITATHCHHGAIEEIEDHSTYVQLVALANSLLGGRHISDERPNAFPQAVIKKLHLSEEVINGSLDAIDHALDELKEMAQQLIA